LVPEGGVRFTGYERTEEQQPVLAIIRDGVLVPESGEVAIESSSEQAEDSTQEGVGGVLELVFASTPFYAESGGQAGDAGIIHADNARFVVEDTLRPMPGLVVHRGRLVDGKLAVGATARLEVDCDKRDATRKNHSATHLLHLALR